MSYLKTRPERLDCYVHLYATNFHIKWIKLVRFLSHGKIVNFFVSVNRDEFKKKRQRISDLISICKERGSGHHKRMQF